LEVNLENDIVKNVVGLNLSNLPEKNYFTFREIANRWGCDEATISHYIYESRTLKAAIRTEDVRLSQFCYQSSEMTTFSLSHFVNLIYSDSISFAGSFIDINSAKYAREVEGLLDDIDISKLRSCSIRSKKMPPYLYQDMRLEINAEQLSIEPEYRAYFLEVLDFDGNQYLLFDPSKGVIIPRYHNEFKIITKEERDRFEIENNMFNTTKTPDEFCEDTNTVPNIENGTIQASRELVLKGWLVGRNIDFSAEVEDLTRQQLWNELSKASPELFRSLGKYAINDFFGLQKLCSFRRGRPKEGV
jgi:hypothetical protein